MWSGYRNGLRVASVSGDVIHLYGLGRHILRSGQVIWNRPADGLRAVDSRLRGLCRKNRHNGHAGIAAAAGTHFINPVVEHGHLTIQCGNALFQFLQTLIRFMQRFLVCAAVFLEPAHLGC